MLNFDELDLLVRIVVGTLWARIMEGESVFVVGLDG